MALNLTLDRQGKVALYHQMAEQIKTRIGDGRLPAGTRLPTVRQMAKDAGVTRLTVQNAYGELQAGGWVEATVGRGTFVSKNARNGALSGNIGADVSPDAVINDIVTLEQLAGIRSMASASPDPALFPAEEFWSIAAKLSNDVSLATYSPSQGDAELRVQLASWSQEVGIEALPDQILITAGASQGLALTAQALTRPGDTVAVEQPTYLGLLHTLKAQGLQPVGIPLDKNGPQLDALERIIVQQRPRFFYTIPSYQNPTGYCATPERRRQLLELSRQYGLIVVEDDIYTRLSYDDRPPLPLKASDRSGLVVHVGSFSKLSSPGLRIGYVIAPSPLDQELLSLRRAADLCSPTMLQRAMAEFLAEGGMKRHIRRVLPLYRQRRNAVLAAMQRNMPPSVSWTKPAGGFTSWLTLPPINTFDDLHRAALHQGWAFAPGEAFLVQNDGQRHLRVCFGHQDPAVISEGIATLALLIRERLVVEPNRSHRVHDWTPMV